MNVKLASGKVVGEVIGVVFVKRVTGKKHFLRRPPAIAFDIFTLTEAERLGANTVRIIDEDTNLSLWASVELIRTKGFSFNRGFGLQIALPLTEWREHNDEQLGLL